MTQSDDNLHDSPIRHPKPSNLVLTMPTISVDKYKLYEALGRKYVSSTGHLRL